MRISKILLSALFLMSFGTLASAQTIDFEPGGLFDTGEYVISSDNGTPFAVGDFDSFPNNVYGWCAEDCVGLSTLTLNRADNQPFSVFSLDAGFLFNTTDANPLVVTGNLSEGGTVVENLTLTTTPPALATYPLNSFVNVVSVTFSKVDDGVGGLADAAIDNIALAPAAPTTPPTPVPTLPLAALGLLGGLAGLLGMRQLRKAA